MLPITNWTPPFVMVVHKGSPATHDMLVEYEIFVMQNDLELVWVCRGNDIKIGQNEDIQKGWRHRSMAEHKSIQRVRPKIAPSQ
jgi:hypothetical protein